MSDRCYMTVTCMTKNKEIFEDLGFEVMEDTENGEIITLEDQSANYAHSRDMPCNIPYYGSHCAGSSYGPMRFACDGAEYFEVSEMGDSGAICVEVDHNGDVAPESVHHVKQYLRVVAQVCALFKTMYSEECKQTLSGDS